jgi:hypothetical protein
LDRVANRLNNNPNAVDRVHAAIDARLNKPTTQPTPAPATQPTPAAPAATTEAIAAPKEETMEKMRKLSEAEATENKKARGMAVNKILKQDARLAEVDANFDKAVKELEDAGKLQVSCRPKL